jgi:hypothetical protein
MAYVKRYGCGEFVNFTLAKTPLRLGFAEPLFRGEPRVSPVLRTPISWGEEPRFCEAATFQNLGSSPPQSGGEVAREA